MSYTAEEDGAFAARIPSMYDAKMVDPGARPVSRGTVADRFEKGTFSRWVGKFNPLGHHDLRASFNFVVGTFLRYPCRHYAIS